jgi:hypothetical protein
MPFGGINLALLEEAVMLLDRVRQQPFDARGGRRVLRVRQLRCVLAIALSSALAAFMPLAPASPPDPVSVDGMYDAADYDDVVLLITSQEALAETPLAVMSLVSIVASILPETTERSSATSPRTVSSRAPPKF